jgi:ubiquinone/menaquinone biosynthesis C-methylase UbiE
MSSRSRQRVNYDTIAHIYDEPLRDYNIDANLIAYLNTKPHTQLSDVRILDLGCGTGKQLTANRERFPALSMTGLDLFRGMLQQARKRCTSVHWVQGNSAGPPFRDNSFDYVTNQFSYSHVLDKRGLIQGTYRILKSGGRFAITHIDPWSMADWILYRFFPAARERDFQDFLPVDEIIAMMARAGFCNMHVDRQYRQDKEDAKEFLRYASQRHRTSQLMVIQDRDYEAGIARLGRMVEDSGVNRQVDSEFCLVTVLADKGV